MRSLLARRYLHCAVIQGFFEPACALIRMAPEPSFLDIQNYDCQVSGSLRACAPVGAVEPLALLGVSLPRGTGRGESRGRSSFATEGGM